MEKENKQQSFKEQYQQERQYQECKFDYESAMFQQQMAEKQVADFWLSLKADGVLVLAMLFLEVFRLQCEKNLMVFGVIGGLGQIVQLILLITLGYALWKIRFGFVYKKRKRHLEVTQDTVVYYASRLCELEQQLGTVKNEEGDNVFFHREQTEKEEQKEQIYSAWAKRLRNDRLEKEYAKISRAIEELNQEEEKLKAKMKVYGRITLGITAFLSLGIVCYPYINLFSQLVIQVLTIVVPIVLWIPFFVLWAKAKIEWLLGEDCLLNQTVFRSFYEVSIQQRRMREVQKLQECRKKMLEVTEAM